MKAKKTILIVAAMLLVAALAVGGTLAYLTSTTDEVVNTFTVGDVEITLTETSEAKDGALAGTPDGTGFKYHILPGLKYDKEPVVTVEEGSEDCYVRAFITIDKSSEFDAIFAANKLTMADVLDFNTTNWTATVVDKDANTRTYEVRYNAKVTEPKALEALFTTLTVPGSLTNKQLESIADFQVTIYAQAIQADGFDNAAAAFAELPGYTAPTTPVAE